TFYFFQSDCNNGRQNIIYIINYNLISKYHILDIRSTDMAKADVFLKWRYTSHYELSGMKENKIVTRFWIIGILLALLSLATFKVDEVKMYFTKEDIKNKKITII
mgnify:CR=1